MIKQPPRTHQLGKTHIRDGAVRQLAVPLVFDLLNLSLAVEVDVDHRRNGLLFANALDDIAGLHVHYNWISGILDLVAKTLDLAEGALETILSRLRQLRFLEVRAVLHCVTHCA